MTRRETTEGGNKGKQRWEQLETAGVDRALMRTKPLSENQRSEDLDKTAGKET